MSRFAITVQYLIGVVYANAKSSGRSGKAEWPPHPDRLFQALVAAAGDSTEFDDLLKWLEAQSAPSLDVSDATTDGHYTKTYSRINWTVKLAVTKKGKKDHDIVRTYPQRDTASFIWDVEIPNDKLQQLQQLASRVSFLGSSESSVRITVDADTQLTPTWVPADVGDIVIRATHSGRLDALRDAFANGYRATCDAWQGYVPAGRQYGGGEWDDIAAFELSGPVDLLHSVQLARAFRSHVMAAMPDPLPEWVSGHQPGGQPSRQSHLAIQPLANVGHAHGDGRVLGVAVFKPVTVATAEWQDLLNGIGDSSLWGNVSFHRPKGGQKTLNPRQWRRASHSWASVTPVIVNRWPKRGAVEAEIRRDIQFAGLPEPDTIELRETSAVTGGLFGQPRNAPKGYRQHVVIHWAEKLAGPIAIGRGRYLGTGICTQVGGNA